ncbi:MAG: T9SS type A sorting domain-containing protein [Chitinophagales bacterium]
MKKLSALLLVICCMVCSNTELFSQTTRNCGTMGHLEMLQQKHPEIVKNMQQIEAHTNKVLQNNSSEQKVNGVINIPVVVHVLYRTSAENISNAQIQSQIDVLNEDFRRLNSDASNTPSDFLGVAADSQIEFCLATTDPSGNSTTGITRKSTTKTTWGTNDAMKKSSQGGVDPWNTSNYLNIWVCNIGGGILGYAQFPGGPAATDGVVCLTTAFGTTGNVNAPFDLGRTTTHEVGHWLNLRHIWGDGGCSVDDFVSDTPIAGSANYTGSPCNYPGPNTCNSGSGDLPDMFQNYMDYSDDGCMNLYTTGQKNRMRALFEVGGARVSLLSSNGCGTPAPNHCTNGTQDSDETGVDCGGADCPACPTVCTDNEVTLTIVLDNYPEETSWSLKNASGTTIASGGTYGSLADGSTVSETFCLADGCYDFTINDAYGDGICCSYGNGSYSISGTSVSGGSFGSSETTNFCLGSGPAPTCSDGVQNGNETGVDCGGSCTACPTCSDGVQNGNETGVDCGGSCTACPTCSDGVQNGNETGVDCGGSCTACPTCSDGVQNGNETGVDCGGSCAPCGGGGSCTYGTIDFDDFEAGWGIWNDGGSDSYRGASSYSYSGSYSIRLRDNTSTSVMTTDNLNLSAYDELTVSFIFQAVSMESGEDFWLQISTNGGSTYTTVAAYAQGSSFNNNTYYTDDVVISGPFTSNTRLRFRCDASGNNDYVYIDDVLIEGCSSSGSRNDGNATELAENIETIQTTADLAMRLFPNPAKNILNVAFDNVSKEAMYITVYDLTGRVVLQQAVNSPTINNKIQLDISKLQKGSYLLQLNSDTQNTVQKFFVY